MILIAYGLPKSASTFVFFTLTNLGEGAGETVWNRLDARMPEGRRNPYQPDIDAGYLDLVRANWPENELLPVKTHCSLNRVLAREILSGGIKACASFRDPRDSVLSLLDAGARDRADGKDSFFAGLHTIEDAIDVVGLQILKTMGWLELPGVMPVPFQLAARHPDTLTRKLAAFAGTQDALSRVDQATPDKENVPEYNKGALNRHEAELSRADRARIEDQFGFHIRFFKRVEREAFEAFGLRYPEDL